MTKFEEAVEFVRAQVAHYEELINRGKGTHGEPGYVQDSSWYGWCGHVDEARRILAELLKIRETERPEPIKRAMAMAIDQLNDLRRHNEILRAKVDTMELLAGFLHAQQPCLSQGMTEDAAWLLQRELDAMEKANG